MSYAVLGSFFGDEGKGQTVYNLCKEVEPQLVVRFSGGPQSGHTVRMHQDVGYIEHVFSNFGCGTFLGIPTFWSRFCAVDPTAAMLEYKELKKLGYPPKVYYDPNCEIVLPYDRIEQITDQDNLMHGTVGTGYKKCLDRARAGYHLTVMDCMNLNVLRCKVMSIVLNYYGHLQSKDLTVNIDQWCIDTFNYFDSIGYMTVNEMYWATNIVFEGSQGILLDQTYGIMPYCTPSNTTCKNIAEMFNRYVIPIFVMRPYITRHGAGPIPSTMEVISVDDPHNQYNDFQKTMRAVKFDVELLKQSVIINTISYPHLKSPDFVVTHIDECPEFRLDIDLDGTQKIRYFEYDKLVKEEH